MNLCVTNRCSRRCEYCFQREWFLENEERPLTEMPLEIAQYALDIFHINQYKLLGGEPLLYTHLDELCQLTRERNLKIEMLSNISVDSKYFSAFMEHNNDVTGGWLVNSDYIPSQENMFLTNLNTLLSYGQQANLGITVVPDQDKAKEYVQRMLNILENSPLGKNKCNFRISTTTPTGNEVYKTYNYTSILKFIINSVVAKYPHVQFYFDCTPTYCEVEPEFFDEMKDRVGRDTKGLCFMPILDILPDGSIIWCSSARFIGLPDVRKFSSDVEILNALTYEWRKYWSKQHVPQKCRECKLYKPFLCDGWCAAKIADVLKTEE